MEQVFQKFRQELPEIEQYIQKYVPEQTLQKLSQPQRGERPEQTNKERYAQIKAQIRIVDYAQQHGYHVVAKGNYTRFLSALNDCIGADLISLEWYRFALEYFTFRSRESDWFPGISFPDL